MKLIPVSMWLLSHDNSFYFISPQGTEHELGCLVKDFIIYMFICLFLNFKSVSSNKYDS